MTLRDIGNWISAKWDVFLGGVDIALTQPFWDWPLWMSIPVGIGVPVIALWWLAKLFEEAEIGEPEPLGWTVGFGVATFLCALVVYDTFVSQVTFKEGEDEWLKIAYPIMTTFFGSYFVVSVIKRRRAKRDKQGED